MMLFQTKVDSSVFWQMEGLKSINIYLHIIQVNAGVIHLLNGDATATTAYRSISAAMARKTATMAAMKRSKSAYHFDAPMLPHNSVVRTVRAWTKVPSAMAPVIVQTTLMNWRQNAARDWNNVCAAHAVTLKSTNADRANAFRLIVSAMVLPTVAINLMRQSRIAPRIAVRQLAFVAATAVAWTMRLNVMEILLECLLFG